MKKTRSLTKQTKIQLLSLMFKIRQAEDKIVEVYAQHEMRTPTHLSIGQEAVSAGLCATLEKKDQIFAAHRCHGPFLAKGGSVDSFFSELCGRANGVNKGRVGSAHLSDYEFGVFASPILGAMIPVAVGAGLAFQMEGLAQVAVALFGDAAIEEGVFTESFNFAVIKKLPVLFICENNYYSTHSHIKDRQPSSPIFKRISIPELKAEQIDGNDVELVYETIRRGVKQCRQGKGPFFLECLTYRIREHVGPLYDFDKGYRSKKEIQDWEKKCPIKLYKKSLVASGVVSLQEIQALEEQFALEAQSAYQKALNSPWPKSEELVGDVY